jgi:hypothetical protein
MKKRLFKVTWTIWALPLILLLIIGLILIVSELKVMYPSQVYFYNIKVPNVLIKPHSLMAKTKNPQEFSSQSPIFFFNNKYVGLSKIKDVIAISNKSDIILIPLKESWKSDILNKIRSNEQRYSKIFQHNSIAISFDKDFNKLKKDDVIRSVYELSSEFLDKNDITVSLVDIHESLL